MLYNSCACCGTPLTQTNTMVVTQLLPTEFVNEQSGKGFISLCSNCNLTFFRYVFAQRSVEEILAQESKIVTTYKQERREAIRQELTDALKYFQPHSPPNELPNLLSIADYLNENNSRTIHGRQWTYQSVYNYLSQLGIRREDYPGPQRTTPSSSTKTELPIINTIPLNGSHPFSQSVPNDEDPNDWLSRSRDEQKPK